MSDLRTAAQQALEAMSSFESGTNGLYEGEFAEEIAVLRAALAEPVQEPVAQRTLTDEVIAELWHKNGGFHHHFARAIERWLKGVA